MRFLLAGAGALAIAYAIPASAEEWNVKIGGLGEYVATNSSSSGGEVDESLGFIGGGFGEVLLGSGKSAGYNMNYEAPTVLFFETRDRNGNLPLSSDAAGVDVGDDWVRGTFGQTALANDRSNDAQRFTYFTPRFSGFQVGASYAPDAGQDPSANADKDSSSLRDFFDLGANYANSFGDLDVAVSGRWGIASDSVNNREPEIWGAGISLDYAGLSVGASYAAQVDSGTADGAAYDAGITYNTGPWGVSFTYFHGSNVTDENPFADENLEVFLFGVSHKLARGVTVAGFAGYANFDEDVGRSGGSGDEVDGFAVGSGIEINF